MRTHRPRLLAAALALGGLCITSGTAACSQPAAPGVATAGGNEPAGSAQARSWAGYDAKMTAWVACLRDNGSAGARYEGHKSSATSLWDEVTGLPTDPLVAAPDDRAAPEDQRGGCGEKAPLPSERPEPYAVPVVSAAEMAERQAFAKCMREQGISDFPDPDSDPGSDAGQPAGGSESKVGDDPKRDAAGNACRKQLGIEGVG